MCEKSSERFARLGFEPWIRIVALLLQIGTRESYDGTQLFSNESTSANNGQKIARIGFPLKFLILIASDRYRRNLNWYLDWKKQFW